MKKFALILITASFFTITTQARTVTDDSLFTGVFSYLSDTSGWLPNSSGCCIIGGPTGNNTVARGTQFEVTSPTHISALVLDIDISFISGLNPNDPNYEYGYEFSSFITSDVFRTVGSNDIKRHLPGGQRGGFTGTNLAASIQTNGDGTSHKDYLLDYDVQLDPELYWLVFRRGSHAYANISNIRLSYENEATTVPEPSTLLLVSPLLFLGFMRRRRKP